MQHLQTVFLALLVSIGLLLSGCDSSGSTDSGGTLAVQLTDAPGDIVEANVTIEQVTAVPAEDTSEGDATEGGTSVLTDSSFTVDLTTLEDGVTQLLGEVQLDAGTYSQIRLKTAQEATAMYEDSNGNPQEANLMLPSASETGVKINFDPVTLDSPDDRAEVTLDFSVEDSFVEAGQTGTYIFKPVVDAKAVVVNGDTTATQGS